jgi:hypothetical protein
MFLKQGEVSKGPFPETEVMAMLRKNHVGPGTLGRHLEVPLNP